jgi:hypothetical protein
MSLAGRTIYQVDQAAFADQSIFRHLIKCCQNSDLDCYICIRVGRYIEKAPTDRAQSLHNFAASDSLSTPFFVLFSLIFNHFTVKRK